MKAQDTSELFFDNVRVPADQPARRGTGMGFIQLMQQLPQERLVIAIQAIAAIEAAMEHTVAYVKERKAFGKPIIDFQNTRFKLAELKTKALVARVFVDDCVAKHLKGELDVATAAMAKYLHHRPAVRADRRVPAVLRRLRLHVGIPDRAALRRRAGAEDLRRHQRDHEGTDRTDALTHYVIPSEQRSGVAKDLHGTTVALFETVLRTPSG